MTAPLADTSATPPSVVLASTSPRRSAILSSLGIIARVVSVEVDETPLLSESPGSMVERLASAKASAALGSDLVSENSLVVAADTTIDLDGVPLGKPIDRDDARRMLKALQGRSHEVITGVAVASVGEGFSSHLIGQTNHTKVTLAPLSDDDIGWYLDTGEPFGKAGSYTIQGVGSWMVTHIEGSFHGVVGLPTATLDAMTRSLGWPLRLLAANAGAVSA